MSLVCFLFVHLFLSLMMCGGTILASLYSVGWDVCLRFPVMVRHLDRVHCLSMTESCTYYERVVLRGWAAKMKYPPLLISSFEEQWSEYIAWICFIVNCFCNKKISMKYNSTNIPNTKTIQFTNYEYNGRFHNFGLNNYL